MRKPSWTHLLARLAVRPLLGTGVTPNHLTALRLVVGLAAAAALAVGEESWTFWGGVLWLVSAFLDRADGELARIGNLCSPGGHAFDYFCDTTVNGVFFIAIGIGLRDGMFGWWAIAMGLAAAVSMWVTDYISEKYDQQQDAGDKLFPQFAGFDIDDVLYLFAPIAWLGWLTPLLAGAAIGAPAFFVVTVLRIRRGNAAHPPAASPSSTPTPTPSHGMAGQ